MRAVNSVQEEQSPEVVAQALGIYRTVTMKNPFQMKFIYAFWTAKMAGQLIDKRFGVKLGKPPFAVCWSSRGSLHNDPFCTPISKSLKTGTI